MHSEVLIIGGGIIGLSIARELHKQGARRITLLEKGVCGQEASWAAAGMLSPQVEADERNAFFDLCCASRDLYPNFAEELLQETGGDVELDRTGTLYLEFDDNDRTEIRKRCEWQRKAGLAVEFLSREEVLSAEPAVSPDIRGALYFPNDWQVESRRLLGALKNYAELNGIDIHENTHVEKLIKENGRVAGVQTINDSIAADATVLATGAWTSLIKLGDLGMPVAIEPVRGQIVEFRTPKRPFGHVMCTKGGYVVPRIDGRVLAGSTSERVGFDKSLSESTACRLMEIACAIVPVLTALEITDHWAGLRPHAPDGLPILGQLSDTQDLFIATGHYRNGILLAPLTAKLVAEKLVNNTHSDYLSMFGHDRFSLGSIGANH
jgi:glycine oxidase